MSDFRELARGMIGDQIDEEKFSFCADDVEAYICAYCGVSAIPGGCQTLAAKMLVEAYSGGSSGAVSGMGGAVQSISRGDFSVTYASGSAERFSGFDSRLNAFRRIRWSGN